jgi:hypothetical protein
MKTCRAETLTSRVERVIEPRVFFLALVVSLQYLERVWGLGFGVRCLVFRVRCYCRVPRNQVPKVGSNPLNGPLVEWFTLCQPNLLGRAVDQPSTKKTYEAKQMTCPLPNKPTRQNGRPVPLSSKPTKQSGRQTLCRANLRGRADNQVICQANL